MVSHPQRTEPARGQDLEIVVHHEVTHVDDQEHVVRGDECLGLVSVKQRDEVALFGRGLENVGGGRGRGREKSGNVRGSARENEKGNVNARGSEFGNETVPNVNGNVPGVCLGRGLVSVGEEQVQKDVDGQWKSEFHETDLHGQGVQETRISSGQCHPKTLAFVTMVVEIKDVRGARIVMKNGANAHEIETMLVVLCHLKMKFAAASNHAIKTKFVSKRTVDHLLTSVAQNQYPENQK